MAVLFYEEELDQLKGPLTLFTAFTLKKKKKYNPNTVKILVSQRGFPITHTRPSGSHFIIIL